MGDSQLKGELNCKCVVCGKELHRKPSYIKKTKNITCSYECSNKLRKITYAGKNNPQYGRRGELSSKFKKKIIRHGYEEEYKPNHPFNKDKHVRKHRLIAEQYLLDDYNTIVINDNKYLLPDFIVHHIDSDKLNNNIDNLCVMLKKDHSAMHISFRTIIRNDDGTIKTVEDKYKSKEEIVKAFYDYINNNNIYYHCIKRVNIPINVKEEIKEKYV